MSKIAKVIRIKAWDEHERPFTITLTCGNLPKIKIGKKRRAEALRK